MEALKSQRKLFLHRLLDPKAIIFGFAVLHFLAMLMYVMRYQQEFAVVSTHWNPVRAMYEPAFLLIAAAALLFNKPWTYLAAVVASARVIYVLGYLGLFAMSEAHDQPMVSWYVFRTWFIVTYESQPQYLLELLLALLIVSYAIVSCSHRL